MVYVQERPISRKPLSPVNWPLLMKPLLMKVSNFTSVSHVGLQPIHEKSRKNMISIHELQH